MAYLSIHVAPGLDARSRRRASEAGPPSVATRTTHESLLASARFVDVEVHDLTAAYREVKLGWIDGFTEHEPEARALMGDAEFEERMHRRRRSLAAIDAGLLVRSLYVATR